MSWFPPSSCEKYRICEKRDENLVLDLDKLYDNDYEYGFIFWNSFPYVDLEEEKIYVLSFINCDVKFIFYIFSSNGQIEKMKSIYVDSSVIRFSEDSDLHLAIISAEKQKIDEKQCLIYYILAYEERQNARFLKFVYNVDDDEFTVYRGTSFDLDKRDITGCYNIIEGEESSGKCYEIWRFDENKVYKITVNG